MVRLLSVREKVPVVSAVCRQTWGNGRPVFSASRLPLWITLPPEWTRSFREHRDLRDVFCGKLSTTTGFSMVVSNRRGVLLHFLFRTLRKGRDANDHDECDMP
jgi:hypothetical protein